MRVLKRNGDREPVSFDKVLRRIEKLCEGLLGVDPHTVSQRVCSRIYDGVRTSELDELAAQTCSTLVTEHPDYGILGARIAVSNHQKNTSPSFSEVMGLLYHAKDVHGKHNPLITDELWEIVQAHRDKLNSVIDYERDFGFDYFGFKTLERSYLMRVDGRTVERPQHMWMRVALGIHGWDLKDALETYDMMSRKLFTHATPTLFNAGTPVGNLGSCFLMGTQDSITGIFKNISDCAVISKHAGGIGIHYHDVRARSSYIRGTNGTSSGIIPFLRVLNNTARAVNQGSKRLGSIAIYLEPWHADVEAFLELRKNQGNEEERCRDLFTALWIPDLFMRRVQENAEWALMCPDECPGLSEAYGTDFDRLYESYEAQGRFKRKVKAQAVWMAILKSQIETGTPYLCYKDAANLKSNQKNLGTIKSSNLCVAPETTILTRRGPVPIADLKDQEVDVWNGEEWSLVTVRQTHDAAALMKVTFSGDAALECTPYHKFYVRCGDSEEVSVKEAQELVTGDRLIEWQTPGGEKVASVCVLSVADHGRVDRTFCFHEPKRHMGVFNGVLAGNCTEIMEYSDHTSYATCNLASVGLPSFVVPGDADAGVPPTFDYAALHRAAGTMTKNINKVIDRTRYPVPETARNNLAHRPIGIGVQGLADVYALMRVPFDSEEAAALNRRIFETIYHGAMTASVEIARKRGALRDELDDPATPEARREEIRAHLRLTEAEAALTRRRGAYASFEGSPTSEGLFQFDLWGVAPEGLWDWAALQKDMLAHGCRNSLLLAPMPTASTSQILGFNECFEPFTSNIYNRRTLAGEFFVINRYLIRDLIRLGLWDVDMKNKILGGNGSIQHIPEIPDDIRALYKTAWELKQKVLIDQAADRGAYVCQSQSLNLFVEDPDMTKLTNMHFYAWKKGLKTGIYYLRTRPRARTQAFTLEPSRARPKQAAEQDEEAATTAAAAAACRRDNPEGCLMCSS